MKQSVSLLKKFIPCATSVVGATFSVFITCYANAASVAQRGTPARPHVTPTVARTPTAKVTATPETITQPKPDTTQNVIEPEETFEFENRTDAFDSALGASNTSASGATSDSELAAMIRKQREALNASDATTTSQNAIRTSIATGQNACDSTLRKCMQSKCGTDFTKCSGDTDTTWGGKMDACRRDTKCTGHEYQLFATEIKADRDINAQLANYNKIIDCGNRYNSCIINECGTTYSKCLGKSAGDLAISKCKKIQTECTQMDNGLASRTMNVFATLRQDAEKQIQRDEQRLYDLRDEMENTCRRLGAMFDQRSLDCVYTINFFAANNPTPYASKKAYAGGVFNCDPGWFGVDVTTFKENAYRETIAQKSASSAMLGSGVGMAAGAITSGAIDRALDTQKAKKALDEAEKGDKKAERDSEKAENKAKRQAEKADKKAERDSEKETEDKSDNKSDQILCKSVGGTWRASTNRCRCKDSSGKTITTSDINECFIETDEEENITDEDEINTTQIVCVDKGGTWSNNKCKCKNAKGRNITTKNPVMDCVKPSETTNDEEDITYDDTESDDSDEENSEDNEYANCVLKMKTNYNAFKIGKEARYQEILAELDAAEEEKLNTFLNTASDHDGNGNCNGQAYSFTAGQKPKDYLPEACWTLHRKDKLFLEQEAKDKFINEKIAQEC